MLPDPIRGMGLRRNSAETQQSDYTPRSGPEVKNRRSSVKNGAPERFNASNPEEGELDPAVDVRRRCKKNSSVLSCIGKKAVTVASKSGQFTASETGKGQFLWENRRSLAEERIVRDISSPGSKAGLPNFAMTRASGMGMGQRKVLLWFWRASLPVYCHGFQRDRRPTESLELRGRKGSRRGFKYPRMTLLGETPELWKEGQGPIGTQLGKRANWK